MTLRDWQDAFARALLNPDEEAFDLLSLAGGPGDLPVERRIGIYRANVIGALGRALEATFPVCRQIIGDRGFGSLARSFVTAHPAVHHDLGLYGRGFPAYLAQWMTAHPGWGEYTYLTDLARFENLRHKAWRTADDPAFDFGAFATAAQHHGEALRLQLSTGLGLLESAHPVQIVWERPQQGTPPSRVSADPGPWYLIVYRRADRVTHRTISEGHFRVLEAIRDNATIGELARDCPQPPLDQILPELITAGLVTGAFR